METNDYSSSVSLEYKPLACELLASLCIFVPLQMSRPGFSFWVPTFPLMCVIIALTFPMGTRRLITWYHPVPTVSAETTGIIKPSCPATVGEAMLGGNIMHLKSVGILPHLLPNKMLLPLIQRDLIVFVILYFVWWTPYKYCLLSMFAWLWYSRHVGIKVSKKVPKSCYDALICWNVYLSRRKMASEGKPCELFERTYWSLRIWWRPQLKCSMKDVKSCNCQTAMYLQSFTYVVASESQP